MKSFALIVATFCSAYVRGQQPGKCDVDVLSGIDSNLAHATQRQVKNFLLTFGHECDNNVEYTEWSNGLLFKLLDRQTELVLTTLEQCEDEFDMVMILETLEDPLLFERADIVRLSRKVQGIAVGKILKENVLHALRMAEGKFD